MKEDLEQISHNYSVVLVVFTITMIAILAVMGVMMHMLLSLRTATNELLVCERESGVECHIERDGTDFNVYWEY